MSARRMLHINMDGQPAEVVVTEVTPGRWSWTIKRAGHAPIGSTIRRANGSTSTEAEDSTVSAIVLKPTQRPV